MCAIIGGEILGRKICFIIVEILSILLILNIKAYLGNPYLILTLLLICVYVGFFLPKFFLVTYFFFLFVLLLFRERIEPGDYHTKQWLTMIFKNKTVFVNVLGNICLFIPLGFALKEKIWIGVLFSIIVELFQRIFDKGVFDYFDIVLNIMGTILGFILWELYLWMIKTKIKRKSMNSLKN